MIGILQVSRKPHSRREQKQPKASTQAKKNNIMRSLLQEYDTKHEHVHTSVCPRVRSIEVVRASRQAARVVAFPKVLSQA